MQKKKNGFRISLFSFKSNVEKDGNQKRKQRKYTYWIMDKKNLTNGTRRWLNFRVASDFERGRKLSKRLVLRVGVEGETRPASSLCSSEPPAAAAAA